MLRQPRLLTMILLAGALVLRATVPVGWMPSDRGAFAIELCSAAAPVAHPMDGHGGKNTHHNTQGKSHSGDCSFAPLQASAAATSLAPPVLAPTPLSSGTPQQQAAAPFFATGPPAPPPPATGPPALA